MTYRVIVTWEDGNWLADVPEVQGAHTYSPYGLAKLDTYVREVTIDDDLPDEAMADLQFEWVFEVSHADMTKGLGKGWTMAQVAALLNVPEDRVAHVPPLAQAAQ
jgi:hypothetical protein